MIDIARILTTAAAATLCTAVASAQLVAVDPFQSTDADGFELQAFQDFQACVKEGAFGNKAIFCTPGENKSFVTGSWIFQCQIGPFKGLKFFGCQAQSAEIVFQQPVSRFGAFFATPSTIPGGTARLFDAQDQLLGVASLDVTANCTWRWNGWQDLTGRGIARVELEGNHPSGGYLLLDEARADMSTPEIVGSPPAISLSQGGTQTLSIDAGAIHAGRPYLVLGTVTGSDPGVDLGPIVLPINSDLYTQFTSEFFDKAPLLGGLGTLDSDGRAVASFQLGGGLAPVFGGLSTRHTALVLDPNTFGILSVSNAEPVALVP